MKTFVENWSVQLRKGILELAVLNELSHESLYSYLLVRKLSRVAGLVVSEGTIYPIVSRLQREGLIKSWLEESPEGPARKYYSLTNAGRNLLPKMRQRFNELADGLKTQETHK